MRVSILGMLEGVLKGLSTKITSTSLLSFNPWYVGGGVKSMIWFDPEDVTCSFNPWYVGGGVKSLQVLVDPLLKGLSFNPWYVGGGVKSCCDCLCERAPQSFQSLVCWRGC